MFDYLRTLYILIFIFFQSFNRFYSKKYRKRIESLFRTVEEELETSKEHYKIKYLDEIVAK